jgi:DNA-nicking Smr family endonuclease
MSRRRRVSDEEEALWRHVTRTVTPLRRHRKDAAANATEAVTETAAKPSRAPSRRSTVAAPKPVPPTRSAVQEPALAPLDRRTRQRLTRGTQDIHARLDLHGRTQSEAHAALLRFLHRAQAQGAKTVLVITGKGGAGAAGERGVLKRQVPHWLALPEFRSLVVGFGPAGAGHGGEGALYVQVRRGRGRIKE